MLTPSDSKTYHLTKHFTVTPNLTDSVELFITVDMRLLTWYVKNLYRSGSLKTVARGLAKYKLDLVGVQGVRWDKMH